MTPRVPVTRCLPALIAPLAVLVGCAQEPPQPVKIENTEEIRATVVAVDNRHRLHVRADDVAAIVRELDAER